MAPRPEKASIAGETRLLSEVQTALGEGQFAQALLLLDQHRQRFPQGTLKQEAMASRVIALCRAGRIQDGRRWSEEFQRSFPTSPLLPRILTACPKDERDFP